MFGFLAQEWKFIGLTPLSLIAITIALSLPMPKQYQKQLTLSINPVPISVSGIPGIDIQQASNQTVKPLENHYDRIDEIEVKPNYNTQTQQIDITVRSPDTRFIAEAASQVSTRLQQDFPAPLSHAIANSLCPIELEINLQQQLLDQLDQPIAQVCDSNSIDPQPIRTAP